MNDTIEHHGVKGMKWGVRKKYISKAIDKVKSGAKKVKELPKNLYNDHVENIRFKYKQKGYSPEEVERRTKRRLKMEKVALASAVAVTTALIAYKLKKDYDYKYVDEVLKKGSEIRTVADVNKLDTNRIFYGATLGTDKTKYAGLYGADRALKGKHDNVIINKFTKDVKVPSKNSAANIFKDLYENDASFREGVKSSIVDFKKGPAWNAGNNGGYNVSGKKSKMLDSILKNKSNKITDKFNQYDAFNTGLVSRDPKAKAAHQKFYDELKKRGYSVLTDSHDREYSGMGSKLPRIVFDGKDSVTQVATKKLSNLDIATEYAKALGLNYLDSEAALAKTAGVASAVAVYRNKKNTRRRLENT